MAFDPTQPYEVVTSGFDPSQPHEVISTGFDPSQPYEVVTEEKKKREPSADLYPAFGAQMDMPSQGPAIAKVAQVPLATNKMFAPYWIGKLAEQGGWPRTAGALEGIAESEAGLTSPLNLGMLAIAPESKLAQAGVATFFEAQALRDAPEQLKRIEETSDPKERSKLITEMAVGLGLPVAGFAHLALRGKTNLREEQPAGKVGEKSYAKETTAEGPQEGFVSETQRFSHESGEAQPTEYQDAGLGPQGAEAERPSDETGGEGAPETSGQFATAGEGREPARQGGAGSLNPEDQFSAASAAAPEPATGLPADRGATGVTPEPGSVQPAVPVTQAPGAEETPVGGVSAGAFERVYGEGEIPTGQSMSPEELFAQGQRDLAAGNDPYRLAGRARTGEVTPRELGELAAEHDRLVTEAAAKEGTSEYDTAWQRSKDFAQNMLKPAGTRWHQVGMGLQIEAPIDFSNLTGFRRAVNERLGREMTPEEAPAFKRVAKDVARAKAEATRSAVNGAEQVQRRFARVKDISFEDAVKGLEEEITKAVKDCAL